MPKKIMVLIFLILFSYFQGLDHSLEGNWKLVDHTGFPAILTSAGFVNLPDEQRIKMSESFQFVLDNTYYNFHGDSVFFTDPGGDFTVREKKGRFLTNSDTLIIMETGKFEIRRFFITSQEERELKMKMIHKDGALGVAEMTFEKEDL